MRQITIVTTVILASLLANAPTAAAHTRYKALSKCPPKNEGVVDADVQAVVYKASTGIFGCAYDAKRAYYLGPSPYGSAQVSGGTFSETLAGPVVAYAIEQTNPVFSRHEIYEILVRNLRTGKIIHRAPLGLPPNQKTSA